MTKAKLIKTDSDYKKTLIRIDEIFDAVPGTEEGDELDLLVTLVELYEKQKYYIEAPDPVSAIKFRMEQQGLKGKDLIPYIGNKSKVSEVLTGKRSLSLSMIRKLNEGLGIPAEVLIKEPQKELPDSIIMEHGKNFPFTEMFRKGWFRKFFDGSLTEAKSLAEELIVNFIGDFKIKDFEMCYNRKTNTVIDEKTNDILMAWRIRVMRIASAEKLPIWNNEILSDDFFAELVKLSYLSEGPKLAKEFLNKAGIHFVIEPHLEKTRLDGSSMLMPDGSPLIALTLRFDRLDSFWFTLFHELAHVKIHLSEKNTAYFDDINNEMSKRIEKEADAYAKKMLIPDDVWKKSRLNIHSGIGDIRCFADTYRISPAIPAGRIRYESGNYKIFTILIGNGSVRKMFNEWR